MRRMKNRVTYLFVVLLATLIFYGGAGVNLITYCCGDCRTEGVAVLLNDNCCEVHEHDCCGTTPEPQAGHSCCNDEDCCGIQRIDFEWSSSDNPVVELQPAVMELLSYGSSLYSLTPYPSNNKYFASNQDSPPVVCPRIYLNMLSVLLI